ncbi:MAG: sulfatase-like hydrolase/transferase [Niabella sp.]
MLKRLKIPKTILWVINIFLMQLLLFTLFRIITFLAFKPDDLGLMDCLQSFALGIQYDLRWIAIFLLPIVLLSIKPSLSPFYSIKNRKIWTWYMVFTMSFMLFFFFADIGSFSYNRTRLDAGAMNFVEDPGISIYMIWQTYPLIWILLGLTFIIVCFKWLFNKSHWQVVNLTSGLAIPHRKGLFILTSIIFCIFIYGKIDIRPLRWKDSFIFRDSFKSYLALNPLQNFFSTMRLRQPVFNEDKARKAFPMMAEFLQLPPEAPFGFKRTATPRSGALESKPNVVLVMCESFSMYKSSMSGNTLNTTPYFDSLTKQGVFFERCFSPHFSTARGLFAILTGIPDAQLFKFSTRNPIAVNQNTIINNFTGYSKHYFLGGDPEFNNFQGLLDNIDQLQVHTEKDIKAPKVNVWGISDRDLFKAANETFTKERKPFFAIVQTSNNHRPYMIPPADTSEFKKLILPKEVLEQNGFESLEEFNTFRYSDFCFRQFIEAAKKESYFHNTIFVFIGDHGVAGNASSVYMPAWTHERLTDEHVPLLIYAPYLVQPAHRNEVVSQIDVLPTIAGLLDMTYTNTTLGRDLLDPYKKGDYAFITNTAGKIGLVTNEFYYIKSLEFPEEDLVPITNDMPAYTASQLDSVQEQLSAFTDAYYQTALYLLLNNKKNRN